MKKRNLLTSIAAVLIAVLTVLCLASCATRLNGTYTSKGLIKQSLTFKGEDTVVLSAFGIDAEGTYKIRDEKITITYKLLNISYDIVKDFRQKGDSIFIDGTEFVKE